MHYKIDSTKSKTIVVKTDDLIVCRSKKLSSVMNFVHDRLRRDQHFRITAGPKLPKIERSAVGRELTRRGETLRGIVVAVWLGVLAVAIYFNY